MNKLNLWQKISEVMKDIEYLQKDDKVSTGGNNSYKAISEEKVTNSVRASLIKNGLVILPIEQEHKRDDTMLKTKKTFNGTTEEKETISRLTTVNTKYKIVDIETGEYEILTSSGTGVDTQDKGVGKAMTYSYKYMLLRTFAIPTGEDPDKISSEEIDKNQQEGKEPTAIISEAQIKRLFAIAKKANYSPGQVKAAIMKKLGINELSQLTKEQYDTVYKGYEGASK